MVVGIMRPHEDLIWGGTERGYATSSDSIPGMGKDLSHTFSIVTNDFSGEWKRFTS